MNSKELIGELSRRLGYTNKDATQLVSSMVQIISEGLQDGKTISIQNFGTFEVKKKMERIIVNPSKQRLLVPPKLILGYKPSQELKEKFKKTNANG